jgi:transposase
MFGATCRHFIARLAGLRLILNCSYGLLLVGYCFGIRSERRLCEEVHLNLAYRWFCRLGLDGEVPDHSTFSKNRHGRFRDCDPLRKLFETVVRRCMAEVLVGGPLLRSMPA